MEYPQNGSLAQQCGIVMPQGQLRVSHDHPVIAMYPLPEGKKRTFREITIRPVHQLGGDGLPTKPDGTTLYLGLGKDK